uniref:C-type lectin domain-containing protein n=1 Tax=Cynoglossus semilaevis TaxID=244447 RepID=A0A3P8UTI9_CYNSE
MTLVSITLLFYCCCYYNFFLSCCSYVQLRKYYYINQNMSWGDAREYCRTHYTDLATIESDNDINGLQSGFSYEKAWIGLWDDPSSWKWSLGSHPNSWRWSSIGEPGRTKGGWYDISCERNHSFVCYTVFHHVNTIKSWYSAQEYCRSHYTDLATIENAMENDMIFNDTQRLYFWIGLSRVPWTWSNRSPVSFTNWQTGQPDNQNSTQFCAAELSDHKWTDEDCSTRMVFICHKNNKYVN